MKFFRKYWFIIILLTIATFLRFYKLSELFFFNIDEDWYSYIVRKIYILHKPVLIGWQIPGGLYVPPVMYYFGTLLMFLSRGNPLGLAINASLFGIVGAFLIYYVGKTLFKSHLIGIYSLIIYVFSYLINIYDRITLTIYLGPILSLLTYLSLFKLIEEKQKKWLFILSGIFIFSTQEGSLISLIFLSIFSLIIFKVKYKLRDYLAPFLIYLATFLPLVIFNFRHQFQLTNGLITFFKLSGFNSKTLTFPFSYLSLMMKTFIRMLVPTGINDLNVQILPCKEYLDHISKVTPSYYPIIGLFLLIIFIVLRQIKKVNLGKKLIIIHLSIVTFGLLVYSIVNPGHLYEWFFVVLFPAYSFIIANLLYYLTNKVHKIIPLFLLTLFIFINLKFIITVNAAVGYKDKIAAVKYAASIINGKDFDLEILGNRCNGYGYRYLFTYIGKEPVKSYIDYQFAEWLYPKTQEKESTVKIVLVPLPDLDTEELRSKYEDYKKEALQSKKFHNLEVLLIQNQLLNQR